MLSHAALSVHVAEFRFFGGVLGKRQRTSQDMNDVLNVICNPYFSI
jgi:hypothetical protein